MPLSPYVKPPSAPFVIVAPSTGTVRIALTEHDLSMQLWNVGKRPAIVETLSIGDAQGELVAWTMTRTPVHPGRVRDFQWPLPRHVPGEGERCTLRITYSDDSGIRYETVSQLLVGHPSCVCDRSRRACVGGRPRVRRAESRLLSSAR